MREPLRRGPERPRRPDIARPTRSATPAEPARAEDTRVGGRGTQRLELFFRAYGYHGSTQELPIFLPTLTAVLPYEFTARALCYLPTPSAIRYWRYTF